MSYLPTDWQALRVEMLSHLKILSLSDRGGIKKIFFAVLDDLDLKIESEKIHSGKVCRPPPPFLENSRIIFPILNDELPKI